MQNSLLYYRHNSESEIPKKLLVRDLRVTSEMLSQWVSNYLRSMPKHGIRHSLAIDL